MYEGILSGTSPGVRSPGPVTVNSPETYPGEDRLVEPVPVPMVFPDRGSFRITGGTGGGPRGNPGGQNAKNEKGINRDGGIPYKVRGSGMVDSGPELDPLSWSVRRPGCETFQSAGIDLDKG